MEDHVLAVDFLGQDNAVFVLTGDAGTVTTVACRRQQIVGGDQANPRTVARVSGIGNRVTLFILEISDARILDAPLFVRRIARNRGTIPDLIDALPIGR